MISFTIPVVPTAQMRPRTTVRGGRVRHYKHEKQKQNEEIIQLLSRKYAPEKPFSTAICVSIVAYMPIPKSWSNAKKQRAINGEIKYIVKPDTDNLEKNILDSLRGIFWTDDKIITCSMTRKVYSDNPRWEIEIWEDK